MRIVRGGVLLCVVLSVGAMLFSGCAYLKDRGNDALDILDVGITFTKEPRIGLYADFQSIGSLGYAEIDGWMLGIGNRRAGWLPMRYHVGGAVLEGREEWAYGDYESDPDIIQKQGVGLGMIYHGVPATVPKAFNCAKFAHLVFIGVNLDCKIMEAVDFVLGWTTLDIGYDDEYLGRAGPGGSGP